MLNFSYKKSYKNISQKAYTPEKKVRWKHSLFSILFFVFLISVCAYVIYQFETRTFDGYLMVRSRELRLADDAYLINNKVSPGDLVHAGDTLFSYVLTGFFMDAINPTNITSGQSEINRLHLRLMELKAEADMYRNRVDSIQVIVEKLKREVNQGIETIKEVESKRWELFVAKEQAKRLESLTNTTSAAYNEALWHLGITGNDLLPPPMYSVRFLTENENIFGNSLLYGIASDELLIVDVPQQAGSLIYKKESVMTVLYTGNGKLMDMHALAFVSPKHLTELENGEAVDIYVGNEKIAKGNMTLAISRMFEVTPSKLGLLTQNGEAVAVRINLDTNNPIQSKYQINNLPVQIRQRRGLFKKCFSIFSKHQ